MAATTEPPWVNKASGTAARNGTTSHTISFGFTSTSGNLLVAVIHGAVTHTASGWTKQAGPVAAGECSLFTKTSAGDSSIAVTHNGSNYPVNYVIYEFASGSTFTGTDSTTGANDTMPALTGLPGTEQVIIAALGRVTTGSETNASISPGAPWIEDGDLFVANSAGTDGAYLAVVHQLNVTATSITPTITPTYSGTWGTVREKISAAFNITPPASTFQKDYVITWNVLNTFTKDYVLRWNVLNTFQKDYTVTWNVLNSFTKDYVIRWNVLNAFTKDYVLSWNVLNSFTKDYVLSWNVLNSFTKDYTILWDVQSGTSFTKDYTITWNVLNSFTKDYSIAWNVLNSFTKDYAVSWNVLNTFTKDYVLTWNISSGFFKDYTVQWNILNIFQKDYIVRWNIQALGDPVWTFWNGTVEVPVTLEGVWDGTQVLPVTVEVT
jgi:uncharacterized cupin superfamily protein